MKEAICYQTTIRETPAIRVAALGHQGDYNQIVTTFQQLASLAAGMNLVGPSTRWFAAYYDDPSSTPRDALRSDACLTVPEGWSPRAGLALREIRGGRYAVTLHVGPYAELPYAYQWLYGTWLEKSGQQLAHAPIVEEYLNDARVVAPSELRTEIWLPLY